MLSINKKKFGTLEGVDVDIYIVRNSNGLELSITNYGGRVTSILVPNKSGKLENIVLGFDNLDDYLKDKYYLGAIIGRFANRISKGVFNLEGKTYTLRVNNGSNHLHGGLKGFDKVVWDVKEVNCKSQKGIKLSYVSKDNEEGYPGNLNVEISYLLTENNEIIIEYKAITDKTTPINLTHHGYFNLSGNFNNDVLNHELRLYSNEFLEMDEESIPTGEYLSVDATSFDFKDFKRIGENIYDENEQLEKGNGYDHCFVLGKDNQELKLVSELSESISGRSMEVYTTEPAIQFYSGNFLSKEEKNIGFGKRTGLCLETQHYPDSPNKAEFPSTILKPEDEYHSKTIYKFNTR